MTIEEQIAALTPRQAIALTAVGEADILGVVGLQATINTIQNRFASGERWWGHDLRSIALCQAANAPHVHQYSCWNGSNPRLPALLATSELDKSYAAALALADEALAGDLADLTDGSTHYVNHELVDPLPDWATDANKRWTLEPHWYYRVI